MWCVICHVPKQEGNGTAQFETAVTHALRTHAKTEISWTTCCADLRVIVLRQWKVASEVGADTQFWYLQYIQKLMQPETCAVKFLDNPSEMVRKV